MPITIRTTLYTTLYCLCGATALLALQTTARAADDDLPSRRVSYADLDISKPAGAKVLYRRIEAAAEQVCGNEGRRNLSAMTRDRACIDEAVATAVARVNSVALRDLHSTHTIHLASQ
jgi:UrcA family protein